MAQVKSLEERFWEKVDIREKHECWEWKGVINNTGYGRTQLNNKRLIASRVSYELTYGKIPDNSSVFHQCNNRKCCNPHHLLLQNFEDRFWAKVNIRKKDECWEWKAGTDKDGYGRFNNKPAHRVSYRMAFGDIPDGLFILHSCDNPKCVNPAHLSLGTPKQNSEDMVKKGRSAKGEKAHKAKLTPDKVVTIKKMIQEGYSQGELAKIFQVQQTTISSIVLGKTWKHIK